MVQNVKHLGGQRYRETFGRSFEDFQVGDVYEHRPGRTITQADNVWFTLLTMNTHPLHFDEEYAKATRVRAVPGGSPLTVAIMVGMSVSDVSQKAIANLGWREIRLTHPLFVGDTLYAESEVLESPRVEESARGRRRHRANDRQEPGRASSSARSSAPSSSRSAGTASRTASTTDCHGDGTSDDERTCTGGGRPPRPRKRTRSST